MNTGVDRHRPHAPDISAEERGEADGGEEGAVEGDFQGGIGDGLDADPTRGQRSAAAAMRTIPRRRSVTRAF
jgi:hypothetical protein